MSHKQLSETEKKRSLLYLNNGETTAEVRIARAVKSF